MSHKTYMVVENEDIVLGIVTAFLGRKNVVTFGAENAFIALDYLKKNEAPDLILTDFNMPDKDGIEFIINAREDYGYSGPVVFMTGRPDALRSEANARKFQIDYLINKPFDMLPFYQTLDSAINGTNKLPQQKSTGSYHI